MPSRQLPFPAPPPLPFPPPHALAQDHHHHRRRNFIAAGASAAAVAVALAALLWWWLRRRKRAAGEDGAGPLQRLSYRRLRRATGGFAAANKLGQGGFGPVFRGALPPVKGGRGGARRPVAVKVMDAAGSLQGEREFHNEIAVASHLLSSSPSSSSSILLPFAYSMSEQGQGQARPRRTMLVYDLMPNGSLQDALLGRRRAELVAEWPRRLAVARDVAAALHYLHSVVTPAVVHGDVKPSNVLLDADLRARLADFGLAQFKSDPDADGKPESGVIAEGQVMAHQGDDDAIAHHPPDGGCDDDVSVVAESTVTTTVNGEGNVAPNKSPEDDEGFTSASPAAEAASTSGFDRTSVDSGINCNGGSRTGTGTDWWWKQDNGTTASIGVKDYVMEWIGSEIKKERPKNDWIADAAATNNPIVPERKKKQKARAREWWREDYVDELDKKQKRRALAKKSKSEQTGLQWWERDLDDDLDEKGPSKWNLVKSWSRRRSSISTSNGNSGINWWVNGARSSSRDWASGDFVPKSGGTVSSTPSMRGTVCYVAPEYGGGGPVSEKCDIYSYGVLLLVIISGRRPLQVTALPMSEFEKASLISWAKHLARASRLLDLVDPAMRDVNRDEALLCITVALLCIQRSPARRPSSEELIAMLSCEGELPQLPLEFSPSPPGGFPFKSRKKGR
ncbi:hypothetical protein QOZ80_5BG0428830 [Eleusine coracana subsp. coracana]|nr:hypothetical protein QOZ80_5BG0428830 [Eleusine coracana subsp. coracana]